VFIGVVSRGDASDDGSTLAANPHLKRILGLEPSIPDELARPFSPATVADADARAAFVSSLARDGAVTDYPLRLQRADGSMVWVEVTARADAEGSDTLHVEALIRDVSERRRRDAESRDMSQQLLQAEKMAALGQTISGVAHELNNPLATILSWAERLAARPLDEISHRGAAVILEEAERAARIVRNLLTFARKRQSTRSLIDLNHVVRETLTRRPREGGEDIELVCTLAEDLPPLLADGHQMQQVLLNLVSNAEQAMLAANGRGRVSVATRVDQARRMAILEVADDGPGVPLEMRSKIFDPFFTTKEVGKGTGLGLTVAYALVEEHGGRIRLESPPEGGACFLVELPLPIGESQPTATSQTSAAVPDLRGTRLLLVEDEPALAGAVKEALIDQGLVVDHAGDGEEALARLRQQPSYDAIVCDLKMPRVDGMMLYRAIAATVPTLARRVIFVTGDVAGTDAERFLAETGSRWLAKPFRLSELLRAVRDTVG